MGQVEEGEGEGGEVGEQAGDDDQGAAPPGDHAPQADQQQAAPHGAHRDQDTGQTHQALPKQGRVLCLK